MIALCACIFLPRKNRLLRFEPLNMANFNLANSLSEMTILET